MEKSAKNENGRRSLGCGDRPKTTDKQWVY
jgi:hypothetical protein